MVSGEYGQYAAECLRFAARVKDPQTKAAFIAMADDWLFLGELADKSAGARHEPQQRSTHPIS